MEYAERKLFWIIICNDNQNSKRSNNHSIQVGGDPVGSSSDEIRIRLLGFFYSFGCLIRSYFTIRKAELDPARDKKCSAAVHSLNLERIPVADAKGNLSGFYLGFGNGLLCSQGTRGFFILRYFEFVVLQIFYDCALDKKLNDV